MQAVHFSIAGFLVAFGALVTAIGHGVQSGFDTATLTVIVTAVVAVIESFLPASQLALSQFKQADVKGDMPKLTK